MLQSQLFFYIFTQMFPVVPDGIVNDIFQELAEHASDLTARLHPQFHEFPSAYRKLAERYALVIEQDFLIQFPHGYNIFNLLLYGLCAFASAMRTAR